MEVQKIFLHCSSTLSFEADSSTDFINMIKINLPHQPALAEPPASAFKAGTAGRLSWPLGIYTGSESAGLFPCLADALTTESSLQLPTLLFGTESH